MKPIISIILFMSLCWPDLASADHHEGSDKRTKIERRYVLKAREAEFEKLVHALAENARELESLGGLGPDIEARISKAMIFSGGPLLGVNIGGLDERPGEVNGVAVVAVTPGGPADKAGVRAGDVIVRLADTPLLASSFDEAAKKLKDVLAEQTIEEPVELELLRDGEQQTLSVDLEQAHGRWFTEEGPHVFAFDGEHGNIDIDISDGGRDFVFDMYVSQAERQWGSVELTKLTPGLGKYFGIDHGLLVVAIRDNADDLPLAEGDVILKIDDREPSSVHHAMRILRSFDAGEDFSIDVMRERKRKSLMVEIPDSSPRPKDSQ